VPGLALHAQYWQLAPTPVETVEGRYPVWQAAVITSSLFGSFQIVYAWLTRKGDP